MKITLRKKDSVTSIVLFLYNLNFEHKENFEISLGQLLEYVKLFDKTESAIRMSLSRLERSDVLGKKIVNDEKYYYLSKAGKEHINAWNLGINRFYNRLKLRQKSWNGQWIVLNLLNFKKSLNNNSIVIEELKELGLRELENNLWITPYMLENEIKALLEENKVDYLMNYSKLEYSHSINHLIENYYNLGKLEDEYIKFDDQLDEIIKRIEKLSDQEAIVILFDLGWQFFNSVTKDPLLPKKINIDWIGIEVQEKFKELRQQLINKAFNYLRKSN